MVYDAKRGKKGQGARNLRAQAAMEYLMTYGWAILVIVVVLAILAYFYPILTRASEQCIFSQPGFTCSENPAIIYNSSSKTTYAAFNLQNGKGQTVNVSKVLCTTGSLSDANLSYAEDVPGDDQMVATGATQRMNAICKDKDGIKIVMSPNTDFRGLIVIYYNYQNDVTNIKRPADAKISGTVLGG